MTLASSPEAARRPAGVDVLAEAGREGSGQTTTGARPWGGIVLLGISVLLIALNLRPVFSSLSVLLPEVVAATGLSPGAASGLTMLPVLCLGLFAPAAPGLARRFGLERMLLVCLLLIGIGSLLRGMGGTAWLFIATALAGSGIALANVLMSGLVKRDFPRHTALMMGLYTMAVCAGAAIAAACTVPLERALDGGWQVGLGLWALPAAVVALMWLPQAWPRPPVEHASTMAGRGVWRDPVAWAVTTFFGFQSSIAYIVMGWLAPLLRARGIEATMAGYVVSVSVLCQVLTCLVVPAIAVRMRNQSGLAMFLPASAVVLLVACLRGPLEGPLGLWTWAVLLGFALGGLFALALTLIVLRSPDAQVASELSGMAQGVGYLMAACGPLGVGLLRGADGRFETVPWLLAAIGLGAVLTGASAGRVRLVGGLRR
jgi:MFS transporter, CP family, cyanate transporter